VLGVIEAVNKAPACLTNTISRAGALCSSAAIALENARLLTKRHHAGQLACCMTRVSCSIARSIRASSGISITHRHAGAPRRQQRLFPLRCRTNEIYYEFGVGRGTDSDTLRACAFRWRGTRLIGWIAQNRVPSICDVAADPRWIVTDPEFHSAFWVPVQHETIAGSALGGQHARQRIHAGRQRLLALFASQVAVSLENAGSTRRPWRLPTPHDSSLLSQECGAVPTGAD